MVVLLAAVLAASGSARVVVDSEERMRAHFGSNWRGLHSDWESLERQAAWVMDGHRKLWAGAISPWCPAASRKLEYVAPEEIRQAILKAIGEACGMTPDEVPVAVCRTFGFGRITDEMRTDVEPHVSALVKAGDLKMNGQNLVLPTGNGAPDPGQGL
jgi:hypothetical protein